MARTVLNPREAVTPVDRDVASVDPLRPMLTAGLLSLALFILACALCYGAVRASPPPLTWPLMSITANLCRAVGVGFSGHGCAPRRAC